MIKIGVVEDQAIIRQGIVELIHFDKKLKVLWQAQDGEDAIEKLEAENVDIVISDIQMPRLNGIELTRQLREKGINIPILILTTFNDNKLLIDAITAGCSGFILKDVSLEKLHEAIHSVAKGNLLIEPQSLDSTLENISQGHGIPPEESFSETEKQILRFIAAGFSNKEISDCIHLAEGTVKNYVSRLLEKTHSRDRTQVVIKAISWKLI